MTAQFTTLSSNYYRRWAAILASPLVADDEDNTIHQFLCNEILSLATPLSSADYSIRRNLLGILNAKLTDYSYGMKENLIDLAKMSFKDEMSEALAYKETLHSFFADIILDDFGINDFLNESKTGYRFKLTSEEEVSLLGIGHYVDNLIELNFTHNYYYIQLGYRLLALCKPETEMPVLSFFNSLFSNVDDATAEFLDITDDDVDDINALYDTLQESLMRGDIPPLDLLGNELMTLGMSLDDIQKNLDPDSPHTAAVTAIISQAKKVLTGNTPALKQPQTPVETAAIPEKEGYIIAKAQVFDRAVMDATLAAMTWDRDALMYAASITKRIAKSDGSKPVYVLSNPSLLDQIIDKLDYEFPHFKEVIAVVKRNLILSIVAKKPLVLPPMLLLGAAGIGKTTFMKRLGEDLGLFSKVIHMESVSGNMSLSGLTTHWGGGHAGLFFETMMDSNVANPIIMLDEIDKTSIQDKANPINALYTVLEKSTASHFVDEAVSVPLDLSLVSWLATANKDMHIIEKELGAALLSRFSIFNINSPTIEERTRIGQTMYSDFITQHGLKHILAPSLPLDVINQISEGSLREMGKAIELGCGSALAAIYKDTDFEHITTKVELSVADVSPDPLNVLRKKRMGFN
jgi:ATP-dependent Lon protease